jgi:acyl-CoA thioester hydrolase
MNGKKYRSHEVTLSVAFHDLDPLHVVWHGNYLKYFDVARFALFKNAGVDLYDYYKRRQYLFPVTRTSTKHILPLRYGDTFMCKATVTEAQIKIAMDFEIRLAGKDAVYAVGKSDQVAVKAPEMELQLEIPRDISRALGFA